MRKHIVEQLAPRRASGQHPGLILNRLLARDVAGDNGDPNERLELLYAASKAGENPSLLALYKLAFERWRDGLPPIRATAELTTPPYTRLIVGLGNKGVIESGIRLHHTYGLPFVPGSALKGVAAHYCDEVWGKADSRYRRGEVFHSLLFGTTDDGGVIRFEDAWMCPESQGILKDVMTPHHQKWQTDPEVAPTDFDSPIPVPFLSVAERFAIAVCWQGPEHPQANAWTERALMILEEALRERGVGGKTSSGYGRLVRPPIGQPSQPRPASGPVKKRDSNAPAQVTIVGTRPNGGFDVSEQGRNQGVIIPGTPPAGVSTEVGSTVAVLVHNDDPKKPQYKWPVLPKR